MRSFNDIQVYKYTQKGMEESFEIPTNVQKKTKEKKIGRTKCNLCFVGFGFSSTNWLM